MALDTESLQNAVVVDCEGKEVGQVLEVHPDAFSGRPGWVAVRGGLLHGKSLVPIGEVEPVDGRLQVPYDTATIRRAPYVDLAASGDAVEEAVNREGGDEESIREDRAQRRHDDYWELYEYYGLPFGRPDTTGAASPEADYGFGSVGTSPEAEGASRTPEEIVAAHPEAAEDFAAAARPVGGGPAEGGPSAGGPSEGGPAEGGAGAPGTPVTSPAEPTAGFPTGSTEEPGTGSTAASAARPQA